MPRRTLYRYQVTVQGQSDFPIDMLRYDQLYPHHESTSAQITRSLQDPIMYESAVIDLDGIHPDGWMPNQARWQSRGWKVNRVTRGDPVV